MRVGFLSLALIVVAFAGAPGSPTSATRTAFAQSQQPRNQAQSQEGLPPDKKKTLSSFGPEDVFGVPEEDPRNRQQGKQTRKPQPTPALQSPPPQRQPATSAAATPPRRPLRGLPRRQFNLLRRNQVRQLPPQPLRMGFNHLLSARKILPTSSFPNGWRLLAW